MAPPDPVLDQAAPSQQAVSRQALCKQAVSKQAVSMQALSNQRFSNQALKDPAFPQQLPSQPVSRPQVTWARALSLAALLLPLVTLTACGGEGDEMANGGAPVPVNGADAAAVAPPAAVPSPPGAPGSAPLGTPSPGFTPLPSAQQVVGPLASGRADPFAPLPSPQAGSPTASLPAGFLFTGVIQSRGLAQAIVYLGGTETTLSETVSNNVSTKLRAVEFDQPTTTICVGPRGLCPGDDPKAPPLPRGWSVTGIDWRNGLLSMRQGSLPVTCRLVMASVRPPFESSHLTSSCSGPGVKAPTPSSGASSSASPSGPAGPGLPPANPTPSANAAQPPAATQAPNTGRPTPR